MRKLIPLQQAVADFDVSQATLFRWLQDGRLTRYRQAGKGNVTFIDEAELRRALRPHPVTKRRG